MDLAVGAKHVYVVMDLFTKTGECKLVEQCDYPLTGKECVERIYTDVALFEIRDDGVHVLEVFDEEGLAEAKQQISFALIDSTAELAATT